MAKIVIALGGNALGKTPYEQAALIRKTAKPIADLVAAGHQVVVAHGNGPQVGMIQLGLATAASAGAIASDMPFPECGAMSQGYIGYHLQNAIDNELTGRRIRKNVVTLVTQVLVNPNDAAFRNPTKPIGAFYTEAEAKEIMAQRGVTMVEDAGRGWRQVVPSPRPVDVVEKYSVSALMRAGHVVITVGGGGIPVVLEDGVLKGVPAVIDKDFASAKLAELIGADELVILTAVERVALDWGKPNQRYVSHMTVAEAQKYCDEGQFAPGSMLPKVQAAMSFAHVGGKAVIAALEKAGEALEGKSGTVIER